MIGLLPIGRIIGLVAVVYAALVAVAIAIVGDRGSIADVGVALSGATGLQLLLICWFYFAWRSVWRRFPFLNHWLFPDIGGVWSMDIHWQRNGANGSVNAIAMIKQDFLRISMEVRSASSESQTLIAQPKKDPESGTPLLYYVYLVTPRAPFSGSVSAYHGAAILKFSWDNGGELKGNYWTTQKTNGHFELSRVG